MTDGSVSLSSVGVLGEVSLHVFDCEFVKSQFFCFSRKRRAYECEDVQPLSRRRTQGVDCGVDKTWAAIYQSVARRMLSYLGHSDLLKVNTRVRESTLSTL